MAMNNKPNVKEINSTGKYWEYEFTNFRLKTFVPDNNLDGETNNYGFRAPLLLVFEEEERTQDEAVRWALETGLSDIAAEADSSVLFVYPTVQGGWKNATIDLYKELIAEIRIESRYEDGVALAYDLLGREFKGFYIRGAKFRTDIYSFGESADYVAKHLLTDVEGEFLWGPGNITPAMCSMERLNVIPEIKRKDIPVLSVGNSSEINEAFKECQHVLIKDKADYRDDFKNFVRRFKMWCGNVESEPIFEELDMTEEAGSAVVKTSHYNRGRFKDFPEHKVGYFAYYNNGIFDNGPVPLLLGFHGAGDSSMFLTFVSGWWEVCHKYGFLFVSFDNHHNAPAEEIMQVLEQLKKRYNIDERRIYAAGFSMGCGKTWDLFQEFPDTFAGVAPASALFPVHKNPLGYDLGDKLNTTVPVPIFYSGGEASFLCELPCQNADGLERIRYAAEVNKVKKKFDKTFEEKDEWEDPIYSIKGDRTEKLFDESRGSTLTIQYYDSEDGICRTAFASVSNQVHEYRHHTADKAWQFISQFSR